MGEHGDSEFVPWSQAMIATKPIRKICEESGWFQWSEMEAIGVEVRTAAQKILEAKQATYYGIGMSMVRIIRAIFGDENRILTVSTMLNGEYGQSGVYAGVPCVINREGVRHILSLPLENEEMEKMQHSCELLRECCQSIHF